MTSQPHILILGAGLTGHSAAVTARAAGFEGRLTLIGDEPRRPYDRTPLSKAVLQGRRDTSDLFFDTEASYRERGITLRTGERATCVDFEQRRVALDSGDTVHYDRLLIATGASPIRLRDPGFDLPGVHYMRQVPDAEAIRDDLAQASHVLVVGAGFIGSEVAASARTLGKDVTLVDLLSAPMVAAFGKSVAEICAEMHQRQGVDLRMNDRVVELRGTGRVEEAVLASGARVPCDLVVVGVGVTPNVEPFASSALEIDNGIVVDEFCESSIPGVFAAGDIANWWHPEVERRFRVEHFDNAGTQGAAAGMSLAGNPEPFAPVPYFWSDQYDTNIQFAGYPGTNYQTAIRGTLDDHEFTAFYVEDGKVRAAVTFNRPRELRPCRRLVAADVYVDIGVLCDPDTDLRKFVREAAAG
jgi:3-phenylpropionate/trans-cinnamate dioxygenase ferredoxin reductase component